MNPQGVANAVIKSNIKGPVCAPTKEKKIFQIKGCLDRSSLVKIIKGIKSRDTSVKFTTHKKNNDELTEFLTKYYYNSCKHHEGCWVKQATNEGSLMTDESKKILDNFFVPQGPASDNAWLSDADIFSVHKQFERAFPDFGFLFPAPIDFAEIQSAVNDITVRKLLKKGKRRFGIIFNTDVHTGTGEHWICFYTDMRTIPTEINFFNPTGEEPTPEITNLIIKTTDDHTQEFGHPPTIKISRKPHQTGGTECGVYCLHFLAMRLGERSMEDYNKKRITDEEVALFRPLFFR